ncbi:MAG: NmrA family NAD(P)-binding protein [Planctomycetota bacterium]|nr:NmrA family NAD(P)-binding protein [Planctomycetota bacterium]
MKIAVTTPTGHIGSKLTDILLEKGAKVILLARDPSKVKQFVIRGAEILQGSLEDEGFVSRATRNVDALFWLSPPNMRATDLRAFQNQLGQSAAQAIRTNDIPRVVNISSIGAHLVSDTGPIAGLHDVENLLNEAAANVTHLRCGFFFENYLYQAEHIKHDASLYLPVSGRRRLPMIATADIARAAAELLLDEQWTGRNVRGLQGPRDLSFDEAAESISRGLGFQVRHLRVAEDTARLAMKSMGAGDNVIETMIEMYHAMSSGLLTPAEPRTRETTTPTTLEQFAHEVLLPLVTEPVAANAYSPG